MSNKFTFSGGIHPAHGKRQTASAALENYPLPEKVIIPMAMHIGAPAKVIVKQGDTVAAGDTIGESAGFVSVPVFASIAGTVTAICETPHPMGQNVVAVEITNDGSNRSKEYTPIENWKNVATSDLIERIKSAGVVGRGGASFPTHVKLSPPPEKNIDTLIVNGAECEPYLTADHRLMLERTKQFLTGAMIVQHILGIKKCYIGIEKNKPDAISAVKKCIKELGYPLVVAPLETKYPQGGEKQLINAITKREVPSGKLPMDVGCVVTNVGTTLSIYKAVVFGTPLYRRVVTVTGSLVGKPGNLIVPVGTSVREVLEYCQTDMSSVKKVLMGGPMMGTALSSLDTPVIKATSGLLVLDSVTPGEQEYNCINCGACVHACPMHLIPSHYSKLVKRNKFEECEQRNILDCMECGSCAFTCPSKINLVHHIRLGKNRIIAAKKAQSSK